MLGNGGGKEEGVFTLEGNNIEDDENNNQDELISIHDAIEEQNNYLNSTDTLPNSRIYPDKIF